MGVLLCGKSIGQDVDGDCKCNYALSYLLSATSSALHYQKI